MPVWNGMPYIEEAVQSVLSQEFENWELLISDNGSTDGTIEFIESLRDTRIRTFRQKVNLGIWGNLNFLLKNATSELIHILCADDYYLAHGLGDIFQAWQSRSVDIVAIRFNSGTMKHSDNRFWRSAYNMIPRTIDPDESDMLYFVFGCFPGILSNVSFRASACRIAGNFRTDLPFASDFEFWSRLNRMAKWSMDDRNICFIRRHPNNASVYLNQNGELVQQAIDVVEPMFNRLEKCLPEMLLRIHASLAYDVVHMHAGISMFLRTGRLTYLYEVARASKSSHIFIPFILRWPLYLLTMGGRFGRIAVARAIVHRFQKHSNEVMM